VPVLVQVSEPVPVGRVLRLAGGQVVPDLVQDLVQALPPVVPATPTPQSGVKPT